MKCRSGHVQLGIEGGSSQLHGLQPVRTKEPWLLKIPFCPGNHPPLWHHTEKNFMQVQQAAVTWEDLHAGASSWGETEDCFFTTKRKGLCKRIGYLCSYSIQIIERDKNGYSPPIPFFWAMKDWIVYLLTLWSRYYFFSWHLHMRDLKLRRFKQTDETLKHIFKVYWCSYG